MPKEENECPECGYDFDEEGDTYICRHCGFSRKKTKPTLKENPEKLPIPELEAELLRITKKVGRLSAYAFELQREIDRRKAL